jgi:hypothetical protein
MKCPTSLLVSSSKPLIFYRNTVLYDYTNKEQDLVKNAFRIGNYHSLRDLPDAVEPFSVTHNLKIKV